MIGISEISSKAFHRRAASSAPVLFLPGIYERMDAGDSKFIARRLTCFSCIPPSPEQFRQS